MWTRLLLSVTSVLSVAYVFHVVADEVTEVETPQGVFKGKVLEAPGGKKVASFLGIPYGVASQRFLNPLASGKIETGLYYATRFMPSCVQPKDDTNSEFEQDESCLFLNVWVPQPDKVGRAVMVYFHGGQNEHGSSTDPELEASMLATHGDVIVVTFNYRLGVFGFMHNLDVTPANSVGNMALKDHQVAMRWVRAYISFFGGDTNRITLFGQGEGAANIMMLVAMMAGRYNFQRVILQSMPNIFDYYRTVNEAKEFGEDIKERFKCPDNVVACLRRVPAKDLLKITDMWEAHETLPLRWLPIVDDWLVVKRPKDLLKTREYRDIDFMIGVNKDEGETFVRHEGQVENRMKKSPSASFHRESSLHMARGGHVQDPEKLKEAYQPDDVDDADKVADALGAMLADRVFVCPANDFAAFIKKQAVKQVYMYHLTYPKGKVAHGSENQWIFGAPFRKGNEDKYDMKDERFSRSVMDKWVQFAKYGDPVFEEDELEWDPYTIDKPAYMELNSEQGYLHRGEHIREEICDLWGS